MFMYMNFCLFQGALKLHSKFYVDSFFLYISLADDVIILFLELLYLFNVKKWKSATEGALMKKFIFSEEFLDSISVQGFWQVYPLSICLQSCCTVKRIRSIHWKVFWKIGVLKFTGNDLQKEQWRSSFLIKLQTRSLQFYWKWT